MDSQSPPTVLFIDSSPSPDPESEEQEDPIPVPVPVALTRPKGGTPLSTIHLEYINDLPEYPVSHVDGYTYVVATGTRSQEEMEQLVNEVQYAKAQKNGRHTVYCPFLDCKVKKWTWKCSGIYCCEFLAPNLKSLHHTAVDDSLWEQVRKYQGNTVRPGEGLGKRNAYNYYRSKITFFKNGHACTNQLTTCKPIFQRNALKNTDGTYTPYISCTNGTTDGLAQHYHGGIEGQIGLDIQFLEELFNNDLPPAAEECGTFESLSSRKQFCGQDHPQGTGRLIHTPCDVGFSALVPVDITQCPYVLFTSHGVHPHPPPPPTTKPPERILQGVEGLIMQVRDASLTTSQFLAAPQLQTFCLQYDFSTLAEIHSGFCNIDRITAIIQKQRLLEDPKGQDINALIFLKGIDSNLDEYIQEYHRDIQGTMVFCGYKDQIERLSRLSFFEVDMSVDRIRSKYMNEVVFTTFLPNQRRIITLLRAFTSLDTTEGYCLLFRRAFNLIHKISGRPVLFDSIHGSGIYGIIVDMGEKQYTGLGQYLSEIDPGHRDVTWHLQRMIIFCNMHFQRSIAEVVGTVDEESRPWTSMASLLAGEEDSHPWTWMISLIEWETEEEYDELLRLLIRRERPEIQNWAIYKQGPVMKAGLNKACSKMRPTCFDALRNHTNAVERSHQKSYPSATYPTLTQAVKTSAGLDKDDITRYKNFVTSNIHHPHVSREGAQKRRRLLTCATTDGVSSPVAESQSEQSMRTSSQHITTNRGDDESVQPSRTLRHAALIDTPADATRESRDLEILEIDVRIKQVRNHSAQIDNDKLEHDLMWRRFRHDAVTKTLSADERREELELRMLEADVRSKEIESHRAQLENEKRELDLMERRFRIQESQAVVDRTGSEIGHSPFSSL